MIKNTTGNAIQGIYHECHMQSYLFVLPLTHTKKGFLWGRKFIDQLSLYPEIHSSFSFHKMLVLGTPYLLMDAQIIHYLHLTY